MITLPFFDASHRDLWSRCEAFSRDVIRPLADRGEREDPLVVGREVVSHAATAGLLSTFAGDGDRSAELRALCIAREAIASASAFADSVLAVQGLGTHPVLSAGGENLKRRFAAPAARGEAVAAFALTEENAGSDPSAVATSARRDGDSYVLSGTKTLISNAGIATFYVVFARTGAEGSKGLSAFVVEAGAPGFAVTKQIEMLAPHPIGDLRMDDCRVPASQRLGEEGDGLKIALATLDFFRASVGAAACGIASRALAEAASFAAARQQFGRPIAEFQATRLAIADMATELDAARLLVYRAAWKKDAGAERVTREASMAKLFATEAAQRIVDRGVQIHGGRGVVRGTVVERLYREIRALRIYEGTSEIQRLVVAAQLLGK